MDLPPHRRVIGPTGATGPTTFYEKILEGSELGEVVPVGATRPRRSSETGHRTAAIDDTTDTRGPCADGSCAVMGRKSRGTLKKRK
jgi:hypothetical protein